MKRVNVWKAGAAFAAMLLLVGCAKYMPPTPGTKDPATDTSTQAATDESNSADVLTQSTVQETPPSMNPLFVANDFITEDWQRAYVSQIAWAETGASVLSGNEIPASQYFLYDMDKDGIPELYIRFGYNEAEYHVRVYKAEGTQAREIGMIPASHTSFYGCEGNGMLAVWGHMGAMTIQKITFDGQTYNYEDIYSEELGEDQYLYTPVSTIDASAHYLSEAYVNTPLAVFTYGGRLATASGNSADVKAYFESALKDECKIFGVSETLRGEKFENITFSTYISKGYADEYYDFVQKNVYYGDMNGDGQEEALVNLESTDNGTYSIAILSFQDGMVYAYYIPYSASADVKINEDGTFGGEDDAPRYQIDFFKDQCIFNYV